MKFQTLGFITASICGALAHGNVVGTDFQNFNPTPQGIDFVTVHSSETLEPGLLNMGLFLNYARNSLPYVDLEGGEARPEDSLLGLDLNIALGLSENWDIGVSLPQVVRQYVESDADVQLFSSNGLTEVRLTTKYRLWGDRTQGIAVIGSSNINTIANNPFTGTNPGPSTSFEVAADTTIDEIAFGANLGYRFRNPGEPIADVPFEPMSNQVIASVAASYLLPRYDTKVITEIYGSWAAEDKASQNARALSSLEMIAGLKHDVNQNMAVHAGLGTGLRHATATPDWRIYAGLSYVIGPVFKRDSASSTDFITVTQQPKYARTLELITAPYEQATFTSDILFGFDSANMNPQARKGFEKLVNHLNSSSFEFLLIEGHTDSVGSEAYNLALSKKRAESVAKYLASEFNVDPAKIKTVGYGESRPIADNGNFQGRQLNRRVDFKIKR